VTSDASAAKVGCLLIAALAAAFGVIVFKEGGLATRGTYRVEVAFPDAQGTMKGDRVRMAGVVIGEVEDVRLAFNEPQFLGEPAVVVLRIENQYPLYENDHFALRQAGLIGERFIGVWRDGTKRFARRIGAGERRKGEASADMGQLYDQASSLMAEAQTAVAGLDETIALATVTFQNVNNIMGDPRMKAELVSALHGLNAAMGRAGQVADEAYKLVHDTRGVLGKKDKQTDEVLDNLKYTTESLRRASAGVNAFMSTTSIPEDLGEAAKQIRETTASTKRTAESVEKLVTDQKTSEDVRASLENLRKATQEGAEAAEKANRVLGRADKFTQKGLALSRRARDIKVRTALDLQYGPRDAWRGDVNVDVLPSPDSRNFYRLGVRDVGDNNHLNLQAGRELGGGQRLRVGLIDSELGVGYDRALGPRLGLEADLFRPDKPELDLRGVYRQRKDTDLLFGVDNVFQKPDVFLGGRKKIEF